MQDKELHRFAYTYDKLCGTENVDEISADFENGRFSVRLKEDAEHQDTGRAMGEELVKAGYAIIGVHQHYTDGDNIDKYSFVEIDAVDDRMPAHFIDGLYYDSESGKFTSEYPNAEGE